MRVKQLLRSHQLRADKRLGQHFLVDTGIHKTIAAAAHLRSTDTVIEVGPGTGLLTGVLSPQVARIIAIEIDHRLVELLQETLADTSNVILVEADILSVTPGQLLTTHGLRGERQYKVVANLPYYIASPVIRHLLTADVRPELMVVMVQEEVGRSMSAAPGDMSVLSVSVQVLAQVSIVRRVPARAFYPPPKVDSMVVRLETISEPAVPLDRIADFIEFVAAGFRSPRKHMRNSLANGLGAPHQYVEALLARAGIELSRRPETLAVAEWVRLWKLHETTGNTPC